MARNVEEKDLDDLELNNCDGEQMGHETYVRMVLTCLLDTWPPSPLINRCWRNLIIENSGPCCGLGTSGSAKGPEIQLVLTSSRSEIEFCVIGFPTGRDGKQEELSLLFFRGIGESSDAPCDLRVLGI